MSDFDVKAARAVCDAAPAGEWHARDTYVYRSGDPRDQRQVARVPGVQIDPRLPHPIATFIAAARTILPAALDEIERLTGCLAKANNNHETFERLWYLTQDEIERLRRLLTEACDYIEADTDPDEEHPLSARLRTQAHTPTTQDSK